MAYVLEHTRLGFCWWDLVALIVLLAVIVVFVRNHKQQKEILRTLEDQVAAEHLPDIEK